MGGEPAFVRPCFCVVTLSNMYISATKRPIAAKFYLTHHLGRERLHQVLDEIGLELWLKWQQKALIWLQGRKSCDHSSAFFFDRTFFILAGNEDIHNIANEFEIWPDRTKDCGVSCH